MAGYKRKDLPTRNGREKGKAGPPTLERRRFNRLTDLLKESIDLRLDAFEDINKQYPDLVKALLAHCKGQASYIDKTGTTAVAADLPTLKYAMGLHQDLYKELAAGLDWTEKKLQENRELSGTADDGASHGAVFSLVPVEK